MAKPKINFTEEDNECFARDTLEQLIERFKPITSNECDIALNKYKLYSQLFTIEDLQQEAWITIWKCKSKYNPYSGVYPFIYYRSALRRNISAYFKKVLPKLTFRDGVWSTNAPRYIHHHILENKLEELGPKDLAYINKIIIKRQTKERDEV